MQLIPVIYKGKYTCTLAQKLWSITVTVEKCYPLEPKAGDSVDKSTTPLKQYKV